MGPAVLASHGVLANPDVLVGRGDPRCHVVHVLEAPCLSLWSEGHVFPLAHDVRDHGVLGLGHVSVAHGLYCVLHDPCAHEVRGLWARDYGPVSGPLYSGPLRFAPCCAPVLGLLCLAGLCPVVPCYDREIEYHGSGPGPGPGFSLLAPCLGLENEALLFYLVPETEALLFYWIHGSVVPLFCLVPANEAPLFCLIPENEALLFCSLPGNEALLFCSVPENEALLFCLVHENVLPLFCSGHVIVPPGWHLDLVTAHLGFYWDHVPVGSSDYPYSSDRYQGGLCYSPGPSLPSPPGGRILCQAGPFLGSVDVRGDSPFGPSGADASGSGPAPSWPAGLGGGGTVGALGLWVPGAAVVLAAAGVAVVVAVAAAVVVVQREVLGRDVAVGGVR